MPTWPVCVTCHVAILSAVKKLKRMLLRKEGTNMIGNFILKYELSSYTSHLP